jgi:hypothetical protein
VSILRLVPPLFLSQAAANRISELTKRPHRKSHKPTCKSSVLASLPDSISKLTERLDAARYQQSRPREFSSFIGPQDVIGAAEQSYKDAMRDAETLLRCEPEYNDEAVNDANWVDARWEWVDVCEKILVGVACLSSPFLCDDRLSLTCGI